MTEAEKQAIEYFENKLQELKEEIKERQNDEFKGYGTLEDIAKLKYCNLHTMLNLIEKQQTEIEKKDKIIDKMVEKLSYVEDLKLDVCVNCKEDCRIPRNQGDCIKTDCIKEYFKNKVEEK